LLSIIKGPSSFSAVTVAAQLGKATSTMNWNILASAIGIRKVKKIFTIVVEEDFQSAIDFLRQGFVVYYI
jgi:hypothetical protein